jgi:membrane protein implicated in regulation of membrane protease activity
MAALFDLWWVWIAGAIVLMVLEVFAPGFLFLGFAAGAALIGLLVAVLGAAPVSVPATLVLFAVLSLGAWFAIRKLSGERKGQVKVWDTDINE